jgi:uncharacterized membrane protein YjfL (UPF0719 family)
MFRRRELHAIVATAFKLTGQTGRFAKLTARNVSTLQCLGWGGGGVVASLSALTGYTGVKFMFLVGLPGPDNPYK